MIASYKKHAGPTDQEIDGFKPLAVRDYYRYTNKVEVFNGIRQAPKNFFKAIRAGRDNCYDILISHRTSLIRFLWNMSCKSWQTRL